MEREGAEEVVNFFAKRGKLAICSVCLLEEVVMNWDRGGLLEGECVLDKAMTEAVSSSQTSVVKSLFRA